MPLALELLCAVAGLACVGLRHGGHRRARGALAVWCSLCFAGPILAPRPCASTEAGLASAHTEPSHVRELKHCG